MGVTFMLIVYFTS